MAEMNRPGVVVGSVAGFAVAALFNAILVVAKETDESIYKWLADTFGHHWVGQGILVIAVFVAVTLVSMWGYRGEELTERAASKLAVVVAVFSLLSVVIIAGFFALHL
ncbi:hypothetical protein [Archaeoglobus neptunius]|uniref:hypothetical protein n=1 Tax=Archaeoglobus neptunius TaxID=2798580 RepID=UPI0019296290|nr:hypothetical protein [Archaeoglobus neptunius]